MMVFTAAVASLRRLYIKFSQDLVYIPIVASSQMEDLTSVGDNRSYQLHRFFRILIAHFFCRCCCYKISYGNNVKVEERYENKDWNLFINKETIPISQDDLHGMRQRYMNSCYDHKYYCFKNVRERCNHSQCFHYETIKLKGLLKHPVLYLLVLNFDDAKEICKEMLTIRALRMGNNNRCYNEDISLEFIFKAAVKQIDQATTGFRYWKGHLGCRINNICLVLQNFPRDYISNFQDEEKLTLENILRLHHNYKFPLMYSIR